MAKSRFLKIRYLYLVAGSKENRARLFSWHPGQDKRNEALTEIQEILLKHKKL